MGAAALEPACLSKQLFGLLIGAAAADWAFSCTLWPHTKIGSHIGLARNGVSTTPRKGKSQHTDSFPEACNPESVGAAHLQQVVCKTRGDGGLHFRGQLAVLRRRSTAGQTWEVLPQQPPPPGLVLCTSPQLHDFHCVCLCTPTASDASHAFSPPTNEAAGIIHVHTFVGSPCRTGNILAPPAPLPQQAALAVGHPPARASSTAGLPGGHLCHIS